MKLFIVNVICTYHITITLYLQYFRSRIGIKQSLKHIERKKMWERILFCQKARQENSNWFEISVNFNSFLSYQYVLRICDDYKAFQQLLNVYLLNVPKTYVY